MHKQRLIEKLIEGLQNIVDNMKNKHSLKMDPRITVTAVDLLQHRVKRIKYKKGFSNVDIVSDHGTTAAYSKIIFSLFELMILDVIAGDIVYIDKKRKNRFYVETKTVSKEFIDGKGITENMRIPMLDLSVTKYKAPFIAYDTGYLSAAPCDVFVPSYLFSALIEEVNNGKKYSKVNKKFNFAKANGD